LNDRENHGTRGPTHVRLALVILEGYVYLALIVAIFLSASGFLVWGVLTFRPFVAIVAILAGIPVLATTARALRALWFVVPEPKGIQVGTHLGALLLQHVQEIGKRVGAPRVHRVIVTNAHNASAMQIPRAGVFWPKNTLAVGYPLLATLSVDQMRAVIAHELGHITHAHGRFASWVHRTRLSWVRLLEILERHQSVPAHVHLLFRFYVPRLHALSAAVSRQQERLADRLASEVTGPAVAAQALMAIAAGQILVSEVFWPRIYERIDEDPNPPHPFAQLGTDLWEGIEDRAQLIDRLLEDDTTASDTHPALRDRLAALNESPRWPDPVTVAAVDYFFGSHKAELASALDTQWQDTQGREWRSRHDEIRERRERLAHLAALSSPTSEQTFERGGLLEDEGDEDAALDLYFSAHEEGHAAAGLAAGRLLLDRDDASGIALIDAAMDADAALVEDGCRRVAEFLEHRGRRVEAYQYQRRMNRETTKTSMARAERAELSAVDQLRPPADHTVDVAALSRRLSTEPGVLRAFFAVKDLRYSLGSQLVLAVVTKNGKAADLGERLRREGLVPETVTIVALGRHDQHLEAAMAAVSGALICGTSRQH
jgi:Zn-dependent protease with chaperone function